MTVDCIAENPNKFRSAWVRQALDQVESYIHGTPVHAFYLQEERKVIYYDIIFDFDEEDPLRVH